MSRFVNPVPQFYLNNGDIASAGKLYFYETGTTTKKDTYSNFGMSVKNTNPVILSGEGRCPNIFGEGRYTVVFKDSDDVEQWTRDDVELSVEIGQYADWSPILTYRVNDIVRGSDGEYYQSTINANSGINPKTVTTAWRALAFFFKYSAEDVFSLEEVVIYLGRFYRSLIDDNQGNEPSASPSEWQDLSSSPTRSFVSGLGGDFSGGAIVLTTDNIDRVSVTVTASVSHPSASSASTSDGIVPEAFRPNTSIYQIYNISNVIRVMELTTSGQLIFNYYGFDGTGASRTSTGGRASLTYTRGF